MEILLVKGYLYDCSKCNKSFSRKWNAERHNERMHDDLSTIRHRKTKSEFEPKLKTKKQYQKSKPNLFQSFNSAIKDNDQGKSFPSYVNSGSDNLKIMKIFGRLAQPFEELEKLMDEYDEKPKSSFLCQIFISCLKSPRPVKSMNETVEAHRSTKCRKKVAKHVAMAYNMSPEEVSLFLDSTIRNSAFFKKNIN
jgi:hypothetical protein